jgi:N-acylneuraminate cytidylyltransferase
MKNFAFVFARGGSKGLPRKNIKPLDGKPLIQYSIDIARRCPSIQDIFVSTDDREIAEVAEHGGATVINRPPNLATDTSPEWLSWRHAISWVAERYGEFDNFISLPATSPLRSVEDVESAITKRRNTVADVCIGVTPASRSPYFNMVTQREDGFMKLVIEPKDAIARRQDAPQVFDITTVVYVASPAFVLDHYGLFSGKVTSIEIPKNRAVDIDDIYDFMLAEAILQEATKQ